MTGILNRGRRHRQVVPPALEAERHPTPILRELHLYRMRAGSLTQLGATGVTKQ